MREILVVASTFPASNSDPVPAFVKNQVIALKKQYPHFRISVLAPHDKRSNTRSHTSHTHYEEYRFHYFWPFSAEKLAGRGILPALKANSLNYVLIPFLFIGEFFALYRLTRRLKPDVIYAHWFTPQAINARWVSVFTRVPFIFTTHAADVDVWHKIPAFGKLIVRSNAKKARAITAVSTRSLAKLQSFFSDDEWSKLQSRTAIIPMGVDIPTASSTTTTSSKKLRIVFLGRLAEKKGVQYLLPAFQEFNNEHKNSELIIAGDGPMLNRLQAQARELGVQQSVHFPGYVSGKQKENVIQSADIYVVPSIITDSGDAEGLPVSLMEGLAYGKVCIATNESGADEVLANGIDGYLIPHKDIKVLVGALKQAASTSDTERRAMQKQARATAQQFSWPNIARKHHEFFKSQL